MHGATIKIVSAQQAKLSNNCKYTRLKLLLLKYTTKCVLQRQRYHRWIYGKARRWVIFGGGTYNNVRKWDHISLSNGDTAIK